MLADYHVHTQYSDDSDYPMEEVVQDALRLGLDALCFTDHVDYGVKRDWDDPRGVLYCPGEMCIRDRSGSVTRTSRLRLGSLLVMLTCSMRTE